MFTEVLGLPLHPLAVHAPVILVPSLLLTALVYALVPKARRYVGWLAILLAVAAPVSVLVARQSGLAYRDAMFGPLELPADHAVEVHADYGNMLLWATIGLGGATLVLYFLRRGAGAGTGVRRVTAWVVTVLLVVLAGVAGFYVFQSGHSGAEMTHGGRVLQN